MKQLNNQSIKHTIILMILFLAGSNIGFCQEKPLKDFAEDFSERKFCLYPSTLRMINLQKNEEYNKLVSGIHKVLIYQLGMKDPNDKLIGLLDDYESLGFEEYARVYGGSQNMALMGKGSLGADQYIGFVGQGKDLFAFYLKGDIKWEKIPSLLTQLQSNDLLNLLNFEPPEFDD